MQSIDITDPVRILDGVGPKMAEDMGLMGINSIADLLQWYPRKYIDASHPSEVGNAPKGVSVALKLQIDKVEEGRTKGRGLHMIKAYCSDQSGSISVQWFNQPYLKQKLQIGSSWIMIGVITRFRGETVLQNPILEATPRIIPRYSQSKKITSRYLSGLLRQVIGLVKVPEVIPEVILKKENMKSIDSVLENIHFPKSQSEIAEAERSLAFAEAWDYFMVMQKERTERESVQGLAIPIDLEVVQQFVTTLPFTLTASQKKDLRSANADWPISRLVPTAPSDIQP